MKKAKILLICLLFVILSQICIAKSDFDRFTAKFNPDYEIATCGVSYHYLTIDNALKSFVVRSTSGIYKGNATNVNFLCAWKFNTLIHTHINGDCNSSKLDLDVLSDSRFFDTSVIYCGLPSYTILIRQGSEIKQFKKS